jgi:predicted RNA binding protein YcfA (HicA-like mRNA interferase family)
VTRRQKLLDRARNDPTDVRCSDLVTLVEAVGFVVVRQRGTSHRRYVHPTLGVYLNLQAKKDGKAKDYQVKQFPAAVDEYGLTLEDERWSSTRS